MVGRQLSFGMVNFEVVEWNAILFLTSRGLALAAEYSTVLYVEDMSGLNDGTVYSIRTARDQVVFSLKKWDFCCDLLGMAVGYGCWVWLLGMAVGYGCWVWLLGMAVGCGCWVWLLGVAVGMATPEIWLRSYQPWPATTLLKFRWGDRTLGFGDGGRAESLLTDEGF